MERERERECVCVLLETREYSSAWRVSILKRERERERESRGKEKDREWLYCILSTPGEYRVRAAIQNLGWSVKLIPTRKLAIVFLARTTDDGLMVPWG